MEKSKYSKQFKFLLFERLKIKSSNYLISDSTEFNRI